MKAIKEIIDIDELRHQIEEILLCPETSDNLVFIDTNILIWIYRLNNESFLELKSLLKSLSVNGQLVIPNWVIHEYNNHLNRYSEDVFFPFKKRLKSLEKEIIYLEEVGRLIVDNELAKNNGFINKKEFIKQTKEEISSIIKKINILTNKHNYKNADRRKFIEYLIENNSSLINLSSIIDNSHSFDFRYTHLIPPGFEDNIKTENKYGDLIIWKEILANCVQRKTKKALFISLDVKKDWVYTPSKVIFDKKELQNGNPSYYYINPWLEQEYIDAVNDGILVVANMRIITDVLYSPDYNPMDFGRFKSLAKTIDIELKNNETNRLIEWFVVHGDKHYLLSTTICKWHRDPGEVDSNEFKSWCIKNISLEIDWDKVDWGNAFVQLFL